MGERYVWNPAQIALAHPTLFTRDELNAYEKQILANPSATERDASHFFRIYPKFLYLGSAAEVRPEVTYSSTPSGKVQRVDFFRRRFGEKFWDIVELKDPRKPVVVGINSLHARLSAEVEKAISQAQDYRDILETSGQARKILESKGIRVWKPQIIVVVGQHGEEDGDEELIRTLLDRIRQRGGIEAWSYTDIFDFAKEHYSKNQLICVPALHLTAIQIGLSDFEVDKVIAIIGDDPERLYSLPPRVFEEVVARLLESQGYDVELTPPGRDGGLDVRAVSRTALGDFVLGVVCKRYQPMNKVRVESVRMLLGTVWSHRLNGGVLVTTSDFSRGALELLERRPDISGIARDQLLQMIYAFLERKP